MSDTETFGKRNHGDQSGDEDDGRSPRKVKPGSTAVPAGDADDVLDADALLDNGSDVIDFDRLSLDDPPTSMLEGVEKLSYWKGGNSACVKVQVLAVKLDKQVNSALKKGQQVDAYNLLIEDTSGVTHICAFEDSAKRLKLSLHDKMGSSIVFRNVFCKAPDEKTKKYLPGNIDYELRFNKLSALEIMEPSTEPVQKLNHLADHLGYQQTDFRALVMSKFHNVASSASKDACYRAWVTDGSFKTEMDVPFQPPYSPGEELLISKAIPHFNGDNVTFSIMSIVDATVVNKDDRLIPRQLPRSSLHQLKLSNAPKHPASVTANKKND